MKKTLIFITVLLLLVGPLGAAVSQVGYSIDWWTVDGGGGASAGGDFNLNGNIGQPEAGYMQGGDFALQIGFFAGGEVRATDSIYLPMVVRSGG